MTILLWLLVALVSLFFLFTGIVKVLGQPKKLFDYQFEAYFKKFGIGRAQVKLIGLAELFGAIIIWLHQRPVIGLAGPIILLLITAGAIFYHLRFGSFRDAVPAIVMFVLTSLVLVLRLF